MNITTKHPGAFAFAVLLCMASASCLSYSYGGLVDDSQLPGKSVIGLNYDEVVGKFGAPARVVALKERKAGPDNQVGEEVTDPRRSKQKHLLVYRRTASYQILLYHRERDTEFVLTMDKGRVVAFQTALSRKSDGFSFSLFPGGTGGATGQPGGPGGGPTR